MLGNSVVSTYLFYIFSSILSMHCRNYTIEYPWKWTKKFEAKKPLLDPVGFNNSGSEDLAFSTGILAGWGPDLLGLILPTFGERESCKLYLSGLINQPSTKSLIWQPYIISLSFWAAGEESQNIDDTRDSSLRCAPFRMTKRRRPPCNWEVTKNLDSYATP